MLSIEGLKVEFAVKPLFHDVSFVVNDRDRIALVGKNGAGKSTLCKELYFNDSYLKKEYKMFVPQDFTFIKGTVEENLMRDDLSKFSKLLGIIPDRKSVV